MSASINLHGPFIASARLVERNLYGGEPFVTLDIETQQGHVQVNLLDITAEGLDSLSVAIDEAHLRLHEVAAAVSVS